MTIIQSLPDSIMSALNLYGLKSDPTYMTAAIPLQKIRVGDIDIEYEVADYTDPWSDSEPETILFHHGFCRNMDFWRGWVPELARNYRVLRFNSRGGGGTTVPVPGEPYHADQLVGDSLGLMDKLGIERAHWVGESSGGILGIVAALTHPERLHSLVLVNTPFKLPGAVMATYNVAEADHATAIEKYGVGGWCRKTLAYRLDLAKAPVEMQEWVIREMGKVANHVGIAHHLMAAGGDMTKRITEIKMPILIMFGENSPLSHHGGDRAARLRDQHVVRARRPRQNAARDHREAQSGGSQRPPQRGDAGTPARPGHRAGRQLARGIHAADARRTAEVGKDSQNIRRQAGLKQRRAIPSRKKQKA